jgi:molecular chaperone DnaJ
MAIRDYHAILGVERNASEADIKTAYRRLASRYHPDKVAESEKATAEARFKEIKEAYEALTNPSPAQPHTTPGGTRSWSFDDFGTHDDFMQQFAEVFRHSSQKHNTRTRTETVTISLADAYIGRTVVLDGNTLHLPKGVRHDARFFLNGKMWRVDIQADDRFKRSNDDLLVDVSITAVEAMIGISITLTHLDGAILQFAVPAGIQSGQIVKLSRKGMKNPESDKTGDLLVRINTTIPRNLTTEEIETLKSINHRTVLEI